MIRRFATVLAIGFVASLSGIFALPALAQEPTAAIIPNLIAPNHDGAQISVTVTRGLTSNKSLRTSALRRARDAMHKGEHVAADDLRSLAQAGDGLAAQRYVRLLLARDEAANPSDIAYFSAVAVGTGRVWTLRNMVKAMHQLDPKTEPKERITKYIQVLYPHAWAGNTLALEAVTAFNGNGQLFGPLSEKTRLRILEQSRKNGDGRIELGMAMSLLERSRAASTPNPDDLAQARSLLEQASASGHLAVSTSAQNLLRLIDKDKTDDT
ncbi:hypothetical protein KO498_06215 [Lentibacter algarum]|uniref:hypothetical protein n=1 Tax=Lentibacter algarum TaxID=576131 RepID=UPI001C06C6F9|nr:hypothetical protein [Lentibacter algarum]MBU2981405.1 hypothetical protein [Lentibacter algarum]